MINYLQNQVPFTPFFFIDNFFFSVFFPLSTFGCKPGTSRYPHHIPLPLGLGLKGITLYAICSFGEATGEIYSKNAIYRILVLQIDSSKGAIT